MPGLLRSPAFRAFLILAATLVAYWTAFDAGFIWDDDDYVTQNPVLREGLAGLARIWFEPTSLPQYYPLVHTTFWIEYQLWELNAQGYHAVNVLLHALNAWLVLGVLQRLRVPGALLAALLFAVHPLHVESVAWVTERKNVLSATFYLLALGAWLRWRPLEDDGDAPEAPRARRLAITAFLLFVGALLSKTVTCSLPAVFLLLVYWKRGRIRRDDVVPILPFFVVGAALAFLTAYLEKVHVKADGLDFAFTVAERFLIAGRAVWFYFLQLLAPLELVFNYPRWELDSASLAQWAWPISAAALVAALFLLRGRIGRGPLVAALFFGGSLLPALGFIDVFPMRYSFVADHFCYLASLGPLVLLAGWATRAARTRLPVAAGLGAAAVVLVLLGAQTWRQGRVYESHETLWTDTLEKNPASWMSHVNLAKRAFDRGEVDVAIERLEAALEIQETFEMHLNLGAARLGKGNVPAARSHFERAIELKPDRPEPKSNLAAALIQQREYPRALELVEESLSIQPDNSNALATRGQVLHALGRSSEGLEDLERALELHPGNGPALAIATTVAQAVGKHQAAITYAANAFVVQGGTPAAATRLANAFATGVRNQSPQQAGAAAAQLFGQLGPAGRPVASESARRLQQLGSAEHASAVRRACGL